jgi:hypothetical protein
MKDREYYEKLISDSLDSPLSRGEAKELELAMREYPELAEFKAELIKQATLVRSLPELRTDAPLMLSKEKPARGSVLWSLWNIRLSVPLPAVALLTLVVVGSVLFGLYTKQAPEEPGETRQATVIKYVQIERLKPATAVLLQSNPNENQSKKEAL